MNNGEHFNGVPDGNKTNNLKSGKSSYRVYGYVRRKTKGRRRHLKNEGRKPRIGKSFLSFLRSFIE